MEKMKNNHKWGIGNSKCWQQNSGRKIVASVPKNDGFDDLKDLKKLTVVRRSKIFFRKKLCYGFCILIIMVIPQNLARREKKVKFVLVHIQQYSMVSKGKKGTNKGKMVIKETQKKKTKS